MKVKTSVTLSPEILKQIDAEVGESSNRSQFIEQILTKYFRQQRRDARNAKDAAIYASLTPEQLADADVLDYSIDPMELGDDVEVLIDRPRQVRAAG